MQCKKCGASITGESKFCGYCGAEIEELPQNNETVVEETINNVTSIVSEPTAQNVVPTTNNQDNKPNKSDKKNNSIFIFLGIILAALAACLIFIATGKNSNNSIIALEKALGNFQKAGDNSGTIKLNVSVKSKSDDNINLSASFMYAKSGDNYDLNFKLNESMLTDEINLYSRINKENIDLYVNSKTIDMIGITNSKLDKFVKYSINLNDFIDSTELKLDTNTDIDVDLKKIIDSKHFKLVDSKDNKHYKLIIDAELLEKLKNSMELDKDQKEQIEDMIKEFKNLDNNNYEVDIYINSKNELVKVEFDLTKYIEQDEIESAIISIEFLNLNSTVVEIPDSAINSTMDLETYISKYYNTDFSLDLGI